MKIAITKEDYIRELTPFYNGCHFRAVIDKNGRVGIEVGCYLLYISLSGFTGILSSQIDDYGEGKKDDKILWGLQPFPPTDKFTYSNDFDPHELKRDIMAIPPCKWCGGLRIEKMDGKDFYKRIGSKGGKKKKTMPTRKIRDITPQQGCTDPEHEPPSHMVFTPGEFEHECPGCGKKTRFTVPLITL